MKCLVLGPTFLLCVLYPIRGFQPKGQVLVSMKEISDGRLEFTLRRKAGTGRELLSLWRALCPGWSPGGWCPVPAVGQSPLVAPWSAPRVFCVPVLPSSPRLCSARCWTPTEPQLGGGSQGLRPRSQPRSRQAARAGTVGRGLTAHPTLPLLNLGLPFLRRTYMSWDAPRLKERFRFRELQTGTCSLLVPQEQAPKWKWSKFYTERYRK